MCSRTKDELIISEHESARSTHDSTSIPRADQTPSLMDHKQKRTQISVSTPHIAGPDHEMNEYKKAVTTTPVTQGLGTDTINSSTSSLPGEQHRIRSRTHPNTNETNTSMSSLPGEHQRVRSRTQHSSTHEMNASASSLSGRNRQPVHPRSSRPTSYVSPPNLQGPAAPAPWWMYPPAPWWLPPPWWLHPQMPMHQPMSPRGGGGQYGYPPQGQWYYSPPPPPPPQWYYPMASTPQQQGPPTPSQVQGRSPQPPLWRYPPSPWQRSQPHLVPQQPPTAVSDESQAQAQQGVSSFEARPVPQQSPYQLPRTNPQQQQHAVHNYVHSQELPPAVPSTAAADHEGYPPQHELQHKELSSADEQYLTHEEPPVWQPKMDDHPSMEDDPPSSEVPLLHTMTDNQLLPQHEEILTKEEPLVETASLLHSTVECEEDQLKITEIPPMELMADDNVQVYHEDIVLEAPPMELIVNGLVLEEEAKTETQPMADSLLLQQGEEHLELHSSEILIHHEESLLEAPPMQLTVNDLVPEEEIMSEAPLPQPMADSLLQQGEDHLELYPPQSRLDDIQVQHEQPLLEASPMQLTLVTEEEAKNEVPHLESTTDSLSQDGEILSLELCPPQPIADNTQVRHEEPLLEAPPMQLIVNDLVPEEEIMSDAVLPQPTADSSLQQGEDHPELHPPQPRLDDIQVQHEEPLLETTPMQLTVNHLVPEEEVKGEVPFLESTTDSLSQDGEDYKILILHPPQPIAESDDAQVHHEEPLLEVLPMQPIVNNLVPDEEAKSEVQPAADSLLQQGDHIELHPPQPRLDDIQVQYEQPLLEATPMQLTVNHLVPEEEVKDEVPLLESITDSLSQDGESHKNLSLELCPPQPIADNIQVCHEEPLLEAPSMQQTVNDLVPEKEIKSAALPQPTADSLLQQEEDHPELHPPQPRLDDVQIQHEQPLLEATPMQLIVNHLVPEEEVKGEVPPLESTTDSLSQDGEDDTIPVLHPPQLIAESDDAQVHHEEPLLEVLPMQPIVNNLVPDEEAKNEVQPAADSLLQQGEDHPELHPPQPRFDDVQVQHVQPLLEATPMQLTVNDLVPEEEIMSDAPLPQPTVASLLQQGEDQLNPPQPRLDDIQVQHEQPLLEATPKQLTVNHLVPKEEVKTEMPLLESTTDSLSQDGESNKNLSLELCPPQPIADNIQVRHEEPLLEAPPMQQTVNDLVPEEEVMSAALPQPTVDSLLQQGEDHPELHPPQPRLDDIQVQHEQLLLEATSMQPTVNHLVPEEEVKSEVPFLESTTDSLSQNGEDDKILAPQPIAESDDAQVHYEEPLPEVPPIVNNMVPDEETKSEVQAAADSLLQHATPDDIQGQDDKEPPLHTSSSHTIPNDSHISDDKVKDLLQPAADSQPLHQDDQISRDELGEIESRSPQLMEKEESNVYTLQELVC